MYIFALYNLASISFSQSGAFCGLQFLNTTTFELCDDEITDTNFELIALD